MKKKSKMQRKISTVLGEFKRGQLHSGKGGPIIKNRRQAVAVAMSEGRRAAAGKR